MLFLDFMLFFVISYFYFSFLVKIEFLVYLRFCKLFKKTNVSIVIIKRKKTCAVSYLKLILLIKI